MRRTGRARSGVAWGPGGFGQYVLVDGYQVYRFPRRVPPLEAALSEPLACVLHDVKRFTPRRGDTAVIIGAGIMGLLHLAALRTSGCGRRGLGAGSRSPRQGA